MLIAFWFSVFVYAAFPQMCVSSISASSVLQCHAVCCSVLQCVAVCCSVMRRLRRCVYPPYLGALQHVVNSYKYVYVSIFHFGAPYICIHVSTKNREIHTYSLNIILVLFGAPFFQSCIDHSQDVVDLRVYIIWVVLKHADCRIL